MTPISLLIEATIGALLHGILCYLISQLPLWLAGERASHWQYFNDVTPTLTKVLAANCPLIGPLLDPFFPPFMLPQPGASEIRVFAQAAANIWLLCNAHRLIGLRRGRARRVAAVVAALRARDVLPTPSEVVAMRERHEGHPGGRSALGLDSAGTDMLVIRGIAAVEAWVSSLDDACYALAAGMLAAVDSRWSHQIWDPIVLSPYMQARRAVDESTLGRLGVPVVCLAAGFFDPRELWYETSLRYAVKFIVNRTLRPQVDDATDVPRPGILQAVTRRLWART
jgi:hypothetical protein